ncbi:MAG: hypothetical protein AABW88_04465 [Nanoarchaeota archaeon]
MTNQYECGLVKEVDILSPRLTLITLESAESPSSVTIPFFDELPHNLVGRIVDYSREESGLIYKIIKQEIKGLDFRKKVEIPKERIAEIYSQIPQEELEKRGLTKE